MKIVKHFQLKIVIFAAVKNRCMLHGRVFVMYAVSDDSEQGAHIPEEEIRCVFEDI